MAWNNTDGAWHVAGSLGAAIVEGLAYGPDTEDLYMLRGLCKARDLIAGDRYLAPPRDRRWAPEVAEAVEAVGFAATVAERRFWARVDGPEPERGASGDAAMACRLLAATWHGADACARQLAAVAERVEDGAASAAEREAAGRVLIALRERGAGE